MDLRLLIVDHTAQESEDLRKILQDRVKEVTVVVSGEEAKALILSGAYDALITEYVLPDFGGKEIIHAILSKFPLFPVFLRSNHVPMEELFQLAQSGVLSYSAKSEDVNEFADTILEKIESSFLLIKDRFPQKQGEQRLPFSQYHSQNAETSKIFKTAIERVAQAPSTVLLLGESGTGKELLAKTIHFHSPRVENSFVAVNCAALSETLIESELFGHEKGSFTGATTRRIGRFEKANGGTFFLDEVGDLSPLVQTKLLRVLQERQIERVGGNKPIPVNVRVIAATHRNLPEMVKRGKFREDLFYRLSVITLDLPPLRKRPEDIPGLTHYFVERFRKQVGREPFLISPRCLRALSNYGWPGNVRELENVIERAVVLSISNKLDITDLPREIASSENDQQAQISLKKARESFEKEYIIDTLYRNKGNVSASSQLLGIARKNLQEKIRKYDIDVDDIRNPDEEESSE